MTAPFFSHIANGRPAVIGMLHLAPLPGAPRYSDNLNWMRERLLRDAEALAEGGVDAFIMENFGDAPFYPGRVPVQVVAHMTALALTVKKRFELPLGINCLRNDGISALAIAHAAGGDFIRVNVLTGARVTDQGIIEGNAHELLRERDHLQVNNIRILADVDVKHSAPLGMPRSLGSEVRDTLQRGLADALIVSGEGTGQATDLEQLRLVKQNAKDAPVFVGSGITIDTAKAYSGVADGLIIGTAFKHQGISSNPVELDRVKALMDQLQQ